MNSPAQNRNENKNVSRFVHLPTLVKMGLALGALLLVLLAGSLSFLLAQREAVGSRTWVAHTHEVIEQSEQLLTALVNQETGVRGYVITGRESFLEPYQAGAADYVKTLAHLRELTRDNAQQQERLLVLDRQVQDWHRLFLEHTIVDASTPATHCTRTRSRASAPARANAAPMRCARCSRNCSRPNWACSSSVKQQPAALKQSGST